MIVTERNAAIIALYQSGLSMADAGAPYGVSCGAVGSLLKRAGIPSRTRGGRATDELTPINDSTLCAAVRLQAIQGSDQLRRRTLTALRNIAAENKRPIGMTMAMCGLNPESRAVVL